jgi:hypothetical protein
MPLFTDPVVLNDGTDDHTFTFLAQLQDNRALVGEWTEPSAEISDESKLVVKQDRSSATVRRRLLQRRINAETVTRGPRPITINVTVAHDVEHTSAQIVPQIGVVRAALAAAGFDVNFLGSQI